MKRFNKTWSEMNRPVYHAKADIKYFFRRLFGKDEYVRSNAPSISKVRMIRFVLCISVAFNIGLLSFNLLTV
ncbi:MAG: hypothetical protein KGV50_02465 [Gammaproteobacteria bacterium]|nr:hypothetical protein [Gammaproteobacteria bacterium]